jgi:hypothetical protein
MFILIKMPIYNKKYKNNNKPNKPQYNKDVDKTRKKYHMIEHDVLSIDPYDENRSDNFLEDINTWFESINNKISSKVLELYKKVNHKKIVYRGDHNGFDKDFYDSGLPSVQLDELNTNKTNKICKNAQECAKMRKNAQ